MNQQDEELRSIFYKFLLIVAMLAALTYAAMSDYRECMAQKHDKFICRTYAWHR